MFERNGRESTYQNLVCIEADERRLRFLMADTPGAILTVEL